MNSEKNAHAYSSALAALVKNDYTTKADSLTEEILLEDYGSYTAIWNAYENNLILLSPELAAGIKAKIEHLNK